ncbi:HD domain-containing protein [Hydromonas duriensis]|uniref:HD domain-containing protein n=1 Tax=Hydromonas duriensis TaxID=1527608 RepID=A0A4R6YAY9_9BURK|nr:HD domain-containing protein [Hydromonas duriensis]TDR32771.1 HD domain-containing protein [Hydromonas duriensis]
MPNVITHIPLLEDILDLWKERIGNDFEGYKNHVYRMLNFCFYLHPATEEEQKKMLIAAAFHDIGIWSDGTVDYLPPSLIQARLYLEKNGLSHWVEEICLIIDEHHKFTAVKNETFPLVEIFRRADLVDFSLGMVKHGVPKSFIKQVKAALPNAGFHKRLMQLTWQQIKKEPFNPAPMMKW